MNSENPASFLKKLSIMRIPLVTQIELTRRCNFHCKFCYLGQNRQAEIKKDILLKAIEEIHSMGGMKLLFTGGEPLLHSEFLKIARQAKRLGFICELNTNGFLLDYYDYKEISMIFASINISLHSADKARHDKLVGYEGAWEKTVSSIKKLKENGANVFVNSVITNGEASNYLAMKHFVEKELQCEWVPDVNICPTYDKDYSSVKTDTVDKNQLRKLAILDRTLVVGASDGGVCSGVCKAARNLCFIDACGYVYPCLSFKIGEDEKTKSRVESIYERNFSDIWKCNAFLLEINSIKKEKFQKCLSCDLYEKCHKCIAENYIASGDYYVPGKEICEKQRIFFG